MTDRNAPNLRSVLYFAATGLALGALIGTLAMHSWLGVGFLVIGLILFIGLWAELDFLTDIAGAVIEPLWRAIARAGQHWAGADPDKPVDGRLRACFALTFLAGLAGGVLIDFSGPKGGA